MNGRGLELTSLKRLIKFDDIRQEIAKTHALNNPDFIVPMEQIKISPNLDMELPGRGTFILTDWAKKQLGSILGITWGKWFDPKLVDHIRMQDELQHRFSRLEDSRKFRTRRFGVGAPGVPGCDGFIRAIVSPTYYAIDNERLFDRMEQKYGSQVRELAFMKNHLSRTEKWGNDHCEYFTVVEQTPVNMGAFQSSDPQVQRAYELQQAETGLPDGDYVYRGFQMRNSEVGYTAVTIDEFQFRLVCTNGMIRSFGKSRVFYRQHRQIEDAELDNQLGRAFTALPELWATTQARMVQLQGLVITDVPETINRTMDRLGATKTFTASVLEAWKKEPLNSGYGVLQALTRAAQMVEDMDRRYEYEVMAGQLTQIL